MLFLCQVSFQLQLSPPGSRELPPRPHRVPLSRGRCGLRGHAVLRVWRAGRLGSPSRCPLVYSSPRTRESLEKGTRRATAESLSGIRSQGRWDQSGWRCGSGRCPSPRTHQAPPQASPERGVAGLTHAASAGAAVVAAHVSLLETRKIRGPQ